MNWYVEIDDRSSPENIYFGPMTKRRARVVADAFAKAFARAGDATQPIVAREITEDEFQREIEFIMEKRVAAEGRA